MRGDKAVASDSRDSLERIKRNGTRSGLTSRLAPPARGIIYLVVISRAEFIPRVAKERVLRLGSMTEKERERGDAHARTHAHTHSRKIASPLR